MTRDEARAEVIDAIEATGDDAADYDVDAVVDEVYVRSTAVHPRPGVTTDKFWRTVERHAVMTRTESRRSKESIMSILTETHEQTTRRLQLLGIPADVIPGLIAYVDALNDSQYQTAKSRFPHLFGMDRLVSEISALGMADLKEFFDVDPNATGAGKYVQVVTMKPHWQTDEIVPGSVHSVVVKADGRVCKSAGWARGPAKSTAKATKGHLLSRYNVAEPGSLAALLERISSDPGAVYGGYL
jgi:hypothetical protein